MKGNGTERKHKRRTIDAEIHKSKLYTVPYFSTYIHAYIHTRLKNIKLWREEKTRVFVLVVLMYMTLFTLQTALIRSFVLLLMYVWFSVLSEIT